MAYYVFKHITYLFYNAVYNCFIHNCIKLIIVCKKTKILRNKKNLTRFQFMLNFVYLNS